MNHPSETFKQLAESAAAAVDVDALAGMPAAELVELTGTIEQLGRIVDAQRVAAASAIDRRSDRWLGTAGLAQSYGYRRGIELIEQITGVSVVTARKRIRLGESIGERDAGLATTLPPRFPVVARAAASGYIGIDAARAITTELTQVGTRADPDALQVAERLLVAQATGRPQDVVDLTSSDLSEAGLAGESADDAMAAGPCPGIMPADLVATQARVWRDALDPDGVEPRADLARARRDVSISRTPVAGLHPLRGMLTPDVAAAAQAFFDSLIKQHGPSFDLAERLALQSPVEHRNYDQQRHDLFAVMVRAAGSAAGSGVDAELPTPAPLVIRVDADQLESPGGTGSISGVDGAVPISYLQQIACDGGVQLMGVRVGAVVKLTTKSRFFTANQRRAVAVRDGDTCAVPGCDVPFVALEAHHAKPYSRGGPTCVDNCVLLCWWHHHMIDSGIWVVEMVKGKPRIRVPIRGNIPLAA